MDRYEIGDFICRTAPLAIALYVTTPNGGYVGAYKVSAKGQAVWHGFASHIGDWRLDWRCADGTVSTDCFEVTRDRVY